MVSRTRSGSRAPITTSLGDFLAIRFLRLRWDIFMVLKRCTQAPNECMYLGLEDISMSSPYLDQPRIC